MNKIFITGRLTKDPELRTTASGIEVCGFTVAVDRKAGKDGEKKCDFIDCTAWRKTGVFVEKYFHKGDGITVEGRLESEKYQDKDGNNRVSWKVTVDEVEFPLGKRSEQNSYSQPSVEVGNMVPVEEIGADTDNGDLPF